MPGARCLDRHCVPRPRSAIRVVRVDLRTPSVTGATSSAEVARVVTASLGPLQACRERPRAIAPIGYEGLRMQFTIGRDGRTMEDIDRGEVAYQLPDIATCMANVIRSLQFPRPSDGHDQRVDCPMGAEFEAR